jgi:hypothetical protein
VSDVERLAAFIAEVVPGEPQFEGEDPVDTAVRLIASYQFNLEKYVDPRYVDDDCSACGAIVDGPMQDLHTQHHRNLVHALVQLFERTPHVTVVQEAAPDGSN